MRASTVFASVFAVAAQASAAATGVTERSLAARGAMDVAESAEVAVAELEAQACDIIGCIAAFAPSVPVCAVALIEPTPLGEIACIAAIVNLGVNTPPPCSGCL